MTGKEDADEIARQWKIRFPEIKEASSIEEAQQTLKKYLKYEPTNKQVKIVKLILAPRTIKFKMRHHWYIAKIDPFGRMIKGMVRRWRRL